MARLCWPLSLGTAVVTVAFFAGGARSPYGASDGANPPAGPSVIFHTSEGDIVISLFFDASPLAAARFLDNAERGVFTGTVFHEVSVDMVYGGAFLADGSFQDAFYGNPPPSEADNGLVHRRGVIGAVAFSPDYQSGEFYIALCEIPHFDGELTIFGEVTEGMEIIDRIAEGAGPDGGRPNLKVAIQDVAVLS